MRRMTAIEYMSTITYITANLSGNKKNTKYIITMTRAPTFVYLAAT